ncbi:MAG: alcohol dehydrogenase [Gammaproteobacteria bacterium (ex Lamellibrachia satsuma)]|nr:MAG: zinc-dependent alcohol dehydrogenase family protein [Gammaproteobacteria bacterium (ex Lamellibrachia satsuma)]RRS31325.1 MAG: alcohol dehydrogenase [Gammaproteobacteria bacterium (ex Lamellibrachia satsuma)]RRS36933.1 MAG: alcohol dehydrogenase [Gammaproteobacteria bacterium (ex Lamellibrachia satsuma)]
MKAVVMNEPGAPEVLSLQDLPEPERMTETQLKVRIEAAGVNPIDTKLRGRGVFLPAGLPAVLGCDGAGVVVETGAEAGEFRTGDEVWFCSGGLGGVQGNYAEFVLVDSSVARKKPASIDFATAAAGPLVLITAWEALFDRARVTAGQTVLIHAGAGGVGHVAIQLAKQAGARVLTTVSTTQKAEFVKSIGADEVILYPEVDFVEAVNDLTGGRGADVVLDTVGPAIFRGSIPAVAHYGDLVTLLDPGQDVEWKEARNRNLRIGFTLMLTPMLRDLPEARAHHGEILERCGELVDAGSLHIEVAKRMPLSKAVEAHRQVEAGHLLGKLVLLP